MKKIVILGNGFDLSASLPTTYQKFFTYRATFMRESFEILDKFFDKRSPAKENDEYKYKENVKSQIDEELNKFDLEFIATLEGSMSFWDFYFWYLIRFTDSNNLNWNDVENEIYKFVSGTNDSSLLSIHSICKADTLKTHNFSRQSKTSYLNDVLVDLDFSKRINIAIFRYLKNKYSAVDFTNIHRILLDELKIFEEAFRVYIKTIMDEAVNINKKHQKIYRDNLLSLIETDRSETFFLLNFNYTCVATTVSLENKTSKTDGSISFERGTKKYKIYETNIHGKFNEISIFGIDQSSIKASDNQYIFTKTYRKISEQSRLSSYPLPRKDEINEIIFYGHSLAYADYSYFQSLFDYYEIYQSNITLTFKYSVYGEENEFDDIRTSAFNSITNLLEMYGESMDNKNHGKNLVHKLLLENRLLVKEIALDKINCDEFSVKYLEFQEILELKSLEMSKRRLSFFR